MFFSLVFIATISIDLIDVIKRKEKKDIIVFLCMSLMAIAFAIFYYSNEFRPSFIMYIFKIFKIEG